MRINIYAEELPETPNPREAVERVEVVAKTGRKFFGARIYLASAEGLHDTPEDDDRTAITFWGPRTKVAALLRAAADAMEERTDG